MKGLTSIGLLLLKRERAGAEAAQQGYHVNFTEDSKSSWVARVSGRRFSGGIPAGRGKRVLIFLPRV